MVSIEVSISGPTSCMTVSFSISLAVSNTRQKKGIRRLSYVCRIPLRWFRSPLLYSG
jgi:hypothetical protein